MMSERASIFDSEAEFDVSGFAPKAKKRGGDAPREIVKAVSEASRFPSREPVKPAALADAVSTSQRREPRRYRTGRNVQLNIKVRSETLNSFYTIADSQGWVLGETLERALTALRKDLAESNSVA
jgi:hypothetical protein